MSLVEGETEQMLRSTGEPTWMTELRSHSLRVFHETPVKDPSDATTLDVIANCGLDIESISRLPLVSEAISNLERHDLGHGNAGSSAEYAVRAGIAPDEFDQGEADVRRRQELADQGVVFCDMNTGVRDHPDLVEEYFGSVVSPDNNKFAALNTAVWSGGVFVYVPPGVEVDLPVQTSRRTRSEHPGPFERTLIVAAKGSKVHFIEGCSAPVYTSTSLHAGVVEIVVEATAQVGYTSIQNWSPNVCNVATKEARVDAEGRLDWTECNIGARLRTGTPTVRLAGSGAAGRICSVAYAGMGQRQAAGANVVHAASNTASNVVSRSVSKDGGVTVCNGIVHVEADALDVKIHSENDALLLDDESVAETAAFVEVRLGGTPSVSDLTVTKISEEQLFYVMSRGLSHEQAMSLIVNGFIEPVLRVLPTEYAVEWSRLIELQMHGSVG